VGGIVAAVVDQGVLDIQKLLAGFNANFGNFDGLTISLSLRDFHRCFQGS